MNNYYQLTITVQLKNDLENLAQYEPLSRLISKAMLNNEELKILHGRAGFKGYVISGLMPVEKSCVYKKGRIYVFNLRCISSDMALQFKRAIKITENDDFRVISTDISSQGYRFITTLNSVTPFVNVVNGKCTNNQQDITELISAIQNNIAKKCKILIKDFSEPQEPFITGVSFINEKPIKIPYKSGFFIGSKAIFQIKEDKVSQQMAFVAMATGILAKNTIGCGYLKAK